MPLIAKPFRGLFLSLFGAFTLFGTSMTIVGAALPKILGDFGWSYAAAGAVLASSAAAYVLTSLFSGRILKRLGPKTSIVTGLSACVLGLAFFAASPGFLVNFLLNALIGAGQGLIEPAVNWSALQMDKDGSGRSMNLMHGAFAIGAVAGPLVLGLILASALSWTLLFRIISLLFALIVVALAFLPFSSLGRVEDGAKSRGTPRRAARGSAYYLGFLCLLLYVGAELGISNWIAEYFVRIFAAAPATASLTVSLFWVGILAGRFGVPALYRGERQELVLVLSSLLLVAATSILCVIGYAAGAAASPFLAGSAFAFTFLIGLGCSIIYPTVISLVGIACKEDQAQSISFSIAGGGVGLFAFPFLMSWISQGWGIKLGFASYALVCALTAAACMALAKTFVKRRRAGA
jgi:fucose permease